MSKLFLQISPVFCICIQDYCVLWLRFLPLSKRYTLIWWIPDYGNFQVTTTTTVQMPKKKGKKKKLDCVF